MCVHLGVHLHMCMIINPILFFEHLSQQCEQLYDMIKQTFFCYNIHINNTNRMTVSINIPFNSHMYVSYPSLVNTVYLTTVIFL